MRSILKEDLCTFMIISRLTLPRMRNIPDKFVEKSKDAFYVQYFFFENRTFYEIMWKNIVQPDRPQMTIWRMRITRWILKATQTHSECVILLFFFSPL